MSEYTPPAESLNRILPALDDIEKTLTDFKVEK